MDACHGTVNEHERNRIISILTSFQKQRKNVIRIYAFSSSMVKSQIWKYALQIALNDIEMNHERSGFYYFIIIIMSKAGFRISKRKYSYIASNDAMACVHVCASDKIASWRFFHALRSCNEYARTRILEPSAILKTSSSFDK